MKKIIKMKIVIFTDTFLPQINGIVNATINLAKGLADKGHKVYIIAPKFKKYSKEIKYKNIKIIRVSSIPAYFYEDFKFTLPFDFNILNILKKEKIDIIHFQTPMSLGVQAIIISKILKKPLVGTFHTFFTDPQYLKHAKLNFNLVQNLSWTYARAYYNQCDLITCPAASTKNELIHNNIKKNIKVISNGINLSKLTLKNNSNNKNKSKNLLFIGRIAYEKNIPYLIDCFRLVLKEISNAKLIIVGDGPQIDEIKKMINKYNLQKNIIMKGRIEHEKLIQSDIFKNSRIFISASTTENQPMTVLEAQAKALPCIGINKRGMKDLIKNNYNGFLVKNNNKKAFAEAIITLLIDERLYEKFRKNTITQIKKEDILNIINIWEKTYFNLIKNYSKDEKN